MKDLKENKRAIVKSKAEKEIQRDTSGVTSLVSNVIDINKIPRHRRIKIMDSQQKNRVTATRS